MTRISPAAGSYSGCSGLLRFALGVICTTYSGHSVAATIVAPVSAFATSNFGPTRNDYSIENTIDQSGLSFKYISGVTDLESYLAKAPKHTSNSNGNEWFSQDFKSRSPQNAVRNRQSSRVSQRPGGGKTTKSFTSMGSQSASTFGSAGGKGSAGKVSQKSNASTQISTNIVSNSKISSVPLVSITYGFNGPIAINGFVLWNDEFAGIGTTELMSSMDGITYTLLSTIAPKPSTFAPAGKVVPYLAQVFSFDLTTMLFFKLLIYDCPGPPPSASRYRGCGIGEVAFSSVPRGPNDFPAVPVPAAFPLLASALGLFAWFGRRRTNI